MISFSPDGSVQIKINICSYEDSYTILFKDSYIRCTVVKFLSFYVLVYKKFLLRIDLQLLGFVYGGKPIDETHYIPSNLIKC